MKDIILLKQGEIVLKGLNKKYFEQRLVSNVKRRLEKFGDFEVYTAQSTIYLEPKAGGCDMDGALDSMLRVFGVVSVTRAAACEKDADSIYRKAKEYLGGALLSAGSFKVEARRSDKRFPMTSIQLSQYVGGLLAEDFPETRVDVHTPELTVSLEVRDYSAYVHSSPMRGAGGLPVGSAGRAVSLLSGGIDSPVSSYMIAKRGAQIIPVHFFSFPYTSELAKQKVVDLASILTGYCGRLVVEIVPFTHIQEEIYKNCPDELTTVITRRFMMRLSEKIAEYNGCGALVTGENLGQVASQTMAAMGVTQECVKLPVLRPLVGMDKEEIVSLARKIGTYETSILPYEDCCTVFTPRHPRTKPNMKEIAEAEAGLDIPALVGEAFAGIQRVRLEERR